MKINSSHLVGAAIALAAVFFSKLDAQYAQMKQQRWEYAHSTSPGLTTLDVFNEMGEMGWEMVLMTSDGRTVYKRPKQ